MSELKKGSLLLLSCYSLLLLLQISSINAYLHSWGNRIFLTRSNALTQRSPRAIPLSPFKSFKTVVRSRLAAVGELNESQESLSGDATATSAELERRMTDCLTVISSSASSSAYSSSSTNTIAASDAEDYLDDRSIEQWEAIVFPLVEELRKVKDRAVLRTLYLHLLSLCALRKLDTLQILTFQQIASSIFLTLQGITAKGAGAEEEEGVEVIDQLSDWHLEFIDRMHTQLNEAAEREQAQSGNELDFEGFEDVDGDNEKQQKKNEVIPTSSPIFYCNQLSLVLSLAFVPLSQVIEFSADAQRFAVQGWLAPIHARMQRRFVGFTSTEIERKQREIKSSAFDRLLSRVKLSLEAKERQPSVNETRSERVYLPGAHARGVVRVLRSALSLCADEVPSLSLHSRLSQSWQQRLNDAVSRIMEPLTVVAKEVYDKPTVLLTVLGAKDTPRLQRDTEIVANTAISAALSLWVAEHAIEGVVVEKIDSNEENETELYDSEGEEREISRERERDREREREKQRQQREERKLRDPSAAATELRVKSPIQPPLSLSSLSDVRSSLPAENAEITYRNLAVSHPEMLKNERDLFGALWFSQNVRREVEIQFSTMAVTGQTASSNSEDTETEHQFSTGSDRDVALRGALVLFFSKTFLSLSLSPSLSNNTNTGDQWDREKFLEELVSLCALEELLGVDEPLRCARESLTLSLVLALSQAMLRGVRPTALLREWDFIERSISGLFRLFPEDTRTLRRDVFLHAVSLAMESLQNGECSLEGQIASPDHNLYTLHSVHKDRAGLTEYLLAASKDWLCELTQSSAEETENQTRELSLTCFDRAVQESLMNSELYFSSSAAQRLCRQQLEKERRQALLDQEASRRRVLFIAGLLLNALLEEVLNGESNVNGPEQRLVELVLKKMFFIFRHPIIAEMRSEEKGKGEAQEEIIKAISLPMEVVFCERARDQEHILEVVRFLDEARQRLIDSDREEGKAKSKGGWGVSTSFSDPFFSTHSDEILELLEDMQVALLDKLPQLSKIQEMMGY